MVSSSQILQARLADVCSIDAFSWVAVFGLTERLLGPNMWRNNAMVGTSNPPQKRRMLRERSGTGVGAVAVTVFVLSVRLIL